MNIAFKQNLLLKKTPKGNGVFTKGEVLPNTIILEFHGEVIPASKVPNPLLLHEDYYLQIAPDAFLGPSGDLDDYLNHSCSPNCGVHIVGQRAFLKSLYLIPANTEITFDYSTTSTDENTTWLLPCQCGNYNCRKLISGFQHLNPALKTRYKSLGIVPKYLMDK
jgi:SET domain-containing protein